MPGMAAKKRVSKKPTAKPAKAAGYDEGLAERIRTLLEERSDVVEKKMFGGVCFLVNGRMCCGLTRSAFMVRVGNEALAEALAQPHTRVMDFSGRPSHGAVYVDPPGYQSDAQLQRWLDRGLALVTAPAVRTRPKRRGS